MRTAVPKRLIQRMTFVIIVTIMYPIPTFSGSCVIFMFHDYCDNGEQTTISQNNTCDSSTQTECVKQSVSQKTNPS